MKEFGQVLRDKRKSLGYTLQDVAERTGFTLQYISDIERGRCTGGIKTIVKICRALDLSMDDIFLSSDYENNEQEEVSKINCL